MNWVTALQSFNLIVRSGSFSKAAEERYSSSSALSKQMAWLEDQLGTRLIQRSTRQIALTDAGKKLYQQSLNWLSQLEELQACVRDDDGELHGELVIAAPVTYGEIVLIQHLPAFIKQHSQLHINLKLDNKFHHIIDENIDVAIRASDVKEKSLVSEKLCAHQHGVFAAPDYLASHKPIKKVMDIADHPCLVHSDFSPPNLWRFQSQTIQVVPRLQTNNLALLIMAAVAGEGLLRVSEYVVAEQLAQKTLVPVLPTQWPAAVTHSIVYPRQPFIPAKTAAFIAFCKACLSAGVE